MKNLKLLTVFIFCLFLFSNCSKSDDNVNVKFDLFLCCNPWDDFPNDATTQEDLISDFLESEGVKNSNLAIVETGPHMMCISCCMCATGKTVFVEIKEMDLQKALDLGFIED